MNDPIVPTLSPLAKAQGARLARQGAVTETLAGWQVADGDQAHLVTWSVPTDYACTCGAALCSHIAAVLLVVRAEGYAIQAQARRTVAERIATLRARRRAARQPWERDALAVLLAALMGTQAPVPAPALAGAA